MKCKKALALLLAAVLTAGILAGCASSASSGSERRLGSFQAVTLDGGTFTQADIAGKDVTIINFWGTFCAPCIAEMPDLAAFAEALPDNVQVVTVCLDGSLDLERTRNVLSEAGFPGVTLVAGDGDLQALCGSLLYTPTTVFADSEGTLVGEPIIGGQRDLSGTFLEAVNQVLAEGGKDAVSLADA